MVFLSLTGGEGSISRSKLTKALKGNSAGLEGLLKKNILQAEKRIISRFEDEVQEEPSTVNLSPLQEETLVNIHKQLEEKQTLLLHGVTSSGKTEIYIRLMQEVVASGGQVLYLLPEIALTGQIIRRLKKYFGEKVGVYHSRYNEEKGRRCGTGFRLNPFSISRGFPSLPAPGRPYFCLLVSSG